MFNYIDKILALFKQFLPTGRAFKIPKNGWLDLLRSALALSENKAYNDALSIQNSILPDNDNFTADDATDWERRLGMIYSPNVLLADRKLAIQRKINHPGTIKARQHYLYIQGQLRAANFDVHVYENRFPFGNGEYYTLDPLSVISPGLQHGNTEHGDGVHGGSPILVGVEHGDKEHGDSQHGGSFSNIIVNYIDEILDQSFFITNNLRSTFFIGGFPLGSFANVPVERHDEFRQLILKLKPAQMVGYLFINYI